MSHIRTTIRDTVKAAITGLTTTGVNVFGPEKENFDDSELPCLSLFTSSDQVSDEGISAGAMYRDLTLVIEGRAKMSGDIDAILDTIDAEVEVAIHSVTSITATTTGMEKDFGDEIESNIGLITIRYLVQYLTREGYPGAMF